MLAAAAAFLPFAANGAAAVLFLDGARLASSSANLEFHLGSARLLSTFRDASSFTGWGFPSVWRCADAGSNASRYRMLYQGWHLDAASGKEDTKLMLMAESADGVAWAPAAVTAQRCGGAAAAVRNCVHDDAGAEFSVVYDDGSALPPPPAGERLKLLWANGTVSVADESGERWTPNWRRWTSAAIDPGLSVFRNPLDAAELVVTARPQSLRKSDGRHAGFHGGGDRGWAGLGAAQNAPALPLDRLTTHTDQSYGLPSFAYGGMVVSFYWRYACTAFPCFKGGNVSAALAFSYNARNWTAFGQDEPRAVMAAAAAAAAPVVPRGPTNGTDLGAGGPAYNHTYVVFANKTAGALACQLACDADARCAAWTYVVGGTCCGVERCCSFSRVGCPVARQGTTSGARVAAPCVTPTPAPPPPPSPAPTPLPLLFPNVPGTATAGQVYPNTLLDMGDGTLLVHASASTHEHGYVSTAPGTWSSLLTYELRRDGFVFVTPAGAGAGAGSASSTSASLVTRPLGWRGGELSVNADCAMPGAELRLSVRDVEGAQLAGYDAVLRGCNETAAAVAWASGATMAALAGRNVSLAATLVGQVKLFALRGDFVHLEQPK